MSKRAGTVLGIFLFALVVSASRFIEAQQGASLDDVLDTDSAEGDDLAITLSR